MDPAPGSGEHGQRFDHLPWLYFEEQVPAEQRAAQRERQQALGGDTVIGERCYVAQSAAVFTDRLRLGDDSYVAAEAETWSGRSGAGAPRSADWRRRR